MQKWYSNTKTGLEKSIGQLCMVQSKSFFSGGGGGGGGAGAFGREASPRLPHWIEPWQYDVFIEKVLQMIEMVLAYLIYKLCTEAGASEYCDYSADHLPYSRGQLLKLYLYC